MLILKQKGQAGLEYILLFTISVFLAGGLLFQFNDAFRQFVNGYFGEYLTCLIESGELPSLGWDGNGVDDTCSTEFQPFSLANGRNPITPGGVTPLGAPAYNAPNYGPTNYVPVGSPNYKDPNPYNGTSANNESRGSDGGGGSGKGSGGNLGGGGGGASGGGSWGGNLLGGKDSGKSRTIGLSKEEREASERSYESTGGGVVGKYARSRKSDDRPTMVPFSSIEETKDDGRAMRVPASKEDAIRGNRVAVGEARRKKKAVDEDVDAGMDFSDLVKYLLIFGIIVAMILFLGGQALQISKSQEK